jgi:hypothetical protein
MILEHYPAKRCLAVDGGFGKWVLYGIPRGGYCASLFYYVLDNP